MAKHQDLALELNRAWKPTTRNPYCDWSHRSSSSYYIQKSKPRDLLYFTMLLMGISAPGGARGPGLLPR